MLKLRLIGRAAVVADPGHTHLLEAKDAAWLAVLALDGPTARDALAAWLWPQAALKTANGNLRQRIFRLRRRIGHELVDAGATLALLPDVACDVRGPADASARDGDEGLLAGCEVDDCPELAAWLERQRAQWRNRRRQAWIGTTEQHEAAGNLALAIEAARRVIDDDPLSEHAQRRLMRLHYLRGDAAAAIAVFEDFERKLKDELGTRPGAETLALLATIERGAAPARIAPRTPVPASLKRPPRMIGRMRELAALEAAWASEQVFLVLGEAGMGKTRLLTEFAAGRGDCCLLLAARPGDAGVPFAFLARLLRTLRERTSSSADDSTRRELSRVLPEIGSGVMVAGEGRWPLLQRAVEWLVLAVAEPPPSASLLDPPALELLLDDLHFADAASLEMLQALSASERLGDVRFGLAQRAGEGGAAGVALHAALAETQRLREVPLAPLDVAQMTELISSLGLAGLDARSLAAPLVRHTGGNPLFALETLKDVVLSGAGFARLPQPATVGTLIERRLKTLSPAALALARVAAIAGVDFSIELAESVLRTPAVALADAWSELQSAQVLNGAAFAHDLVFDAVHRSVPREIGQHLHASIARHLQDMRADPAAVAAHWESGARGLQAAAAWAAAAERARAAGRMREAFDFGQRSARHYGEADRKSDVFAVLLASEPAAMATLDAQALRAWAETLSSAATDPPQRAAALVLRAQVANQLDAPREAASHAAAALTAARELHNELLAMRASRSLALAQAALGNTAEAAATLDAAIAAHAGVLDERERAQALCDHGYLLTKSGRCRQAVVEYDRAYELAVHGADWLVASLALSNSAVTCVLLGRLDEALGRHERARALPLEDEGLSRSIDELTRGAMLTELGRLAEALEALRAAEASVRQSDRSYWASLAAGNLAQLWLVLGQPARALAVAAEFEQAAGEARALEAAALRLRIARAMRQPVELWLERVKALKVTRTLPLLRRLSLETEIAMALPPAPAALRLGALAAEANAVEFFGPALAIAGRRLRPLREAGERDLAASAARECLDALTTTHPYDLYLPLFWRDAADALHATGSGSEASAVLRRATTWIEAAAADLPPELREAFLQRNPVNRELLARATRSA